MVSWPHGPVLTAAGGASGSAWLTDGGEVVDDAVAGRIDGIARTCGAAAIVGGSEAIDDAVAGRTDGIARACGAAAIAGGSESASVGEAGAGASAPDDDSDGA
jgi:hypothetical protein